MRDNIEFGAPWHKLDALSEEERLSRVLDAAEQAQLAETIRSSLPNGLDTTIGERSEHDLSDGQTQRLSLARGLINDFRLLLLDEPTSAVDGPTETKIMEALRKRLSGGVTCVMVAHRMSTLKQCDKIVYMTAGGDGKGATVGEFGTHEELMAADGPYRAFYDEMMKKEESGGGGSGDGDGGDEEKKKRRPRSEREERIRRAYKAAHGRR